jgi:hypothetical protein
MAIPNQYFSVDPFYYYYFNNKKQIKIPSSPSVNNVDFNEGDKNNNNNKEINNSFPFAESFSSSFSENNDNENNWISKNVVSLNKTRYYTFENAKRTLFKAAEKDITAIVTSSSYSNQKQRTYYNCIHSGVYKSSRKINMNLRKRALRTNKCGCPFTVSIVPKNSWYEINVKDGSHNHHRPINKGEYACFRRLNSEQSAFLELLIKRKMKNRDIIFEINNKFKDLDIIQSDVSNYRYKLKKRSSEPGENNMIEFKI